MNRDENPYRPSLVRAEFEPRWRLSLFDTLLAALFIAVFGYVGFCLGSEYIHGGPRCHWQGAIAGVLLGAFVSVIVRKQLRNWPHLLIVAGLVVVAGFIFVVLAILEGPGPTQTFEDIAN